jgi:hypothetical protein
MRIVEFNNGKFAVKRGWWIFSEYLDDNRHAPCRDQWWPCIFDFYKTNALVGSYDIAKNNLDEYLARKLKRNIKIVRSYK